MERTLCITGDKDRGISPIARERKWGLQKILVRGWQWLCPF